jgi:hypothetical protein
VTVGDQEDSEVTDLDLLRRFEPIVRFNDGEYFLPASVESFVGRCELWQRTGPSDKRVVASAGTLDLDRLVELTDGHVAQHSLRLVSSRPSRAEYFAWQHRRDRPRFRPETRLGRVGVLTRLVDAGARVSLLARGRTPRGAQAAAAMLDRDRPDHGDHPYYGRAVRSAGYVVLQYWFFYYFNDWRSRAYGVNDHEGDWEQVTIYLVDTDDDVRPAWIAFSAHDEQGADLRRRWDDPDLTFVDGHPVVFAGLGSHAGAVLPGEYLITVRTQRLSRLTAVARRISRFLQPWAYDDESRTGVGIPYVEYNRGDGVAIGPGTATAWRPVMIDDRTRWVRSYTGLWGDDTNDPFGGERGPAGPRYERDGTVRPSWADPVGWSALDAVAPTELERRAIIDARLEELEAEQDDLATRRSQLRQRLRADTIAAVSDTTVRPAVAPRTRRTGRRERGRTGPPGGDTRRRRRRRAPARPPEPPTGPAGDRPEAASTGPADLGDDQHAAAVRPARLDRAVHRPVDSRQCHRTVRHRARHRGVVPATAHGLCRADRRGGRPGLDRWAGHRWTDRVVADDRCRTVGRLGHCVPRIEPT